MQTAETSFFKGLHVQSGIITQLSDVISAIDADIAFADQMRKRHFNGIAEPAHRSRIHCHITQDQSAARTEYTVHAVEEILRIGIMVKALAADHHIKGILRKGQILAVADHKL